ncbi:MAG: DUF2793 domain-containing protein [Xanthobacteraceae bacterium]
MTDTTHLGLPFIEDSQAQKHVTHNEALRILDAVIQIAVDDMTRTVPPASAAEGQRHVVGSSATGAWAGHDDAIATWQDGAWVFLVPNTGWRLWSGADASIFIFDGGAWQPLAPPANDLSLLGVNTTASTPNLLSVKSNAALLAAISAADGGSGDARMQISKEAAGNTASVFFSDDYSGRAEFGLTGDDHFHLKVSPDGANWQDAFVIDKATANVAFNGFSNAGTTRRQLNAAPIEALGAMNIFPNGGFEGGAEASASAIALTATSALQSVTVVDGVAAAYRGSFVAAVQQVASPFAGGRYALKFTVSSAQASLGADDELSCVLTVPGLHSAKLALGTADAQPQSLGFWFQAHRAGSYSGSIRNGAKTRAYPFSFTVAAADTPQWISLTGIAGDTGGTWTIDASAGLLITICLAAGTSRVGAAATWAGADYSGASGTANGVAATSDVFYIGNVISVPGNELPPSDRAAFTIPPRNGVVRTDAQSLSAAQQAIVRKNLGIGCTPQGRLTLASGVPVMTSSRIGKTTLYYTPTIGSQIPIRDASGVWVAMTFSELSASTTDTTKSPAALTANKVTDWFVWNDDGTLRLSHGDEWASNTSRAAGHGLTLQNGVWINANAITNGPGAGMGTYVGTTCSDGSSQLDFQYGVSGSPPATREYFGVWNAYNRRRVATQYADTTGSYNYSGGPRVANGSIGNQIVFVIGLIEEAIEASYSVYANQAGAPVGAIGIGLNTTSAFSGPVAAAGTIGMMQRGEFVGYPGLGLNTASAVEASGSGQTLTVQSGGPNYTGGLSFKGWF